MNPLRNTLLLLLAFLAPAFAAEPALRVGMELGYPPFEMRNEQGEPAGVSVDLARALGESLGREVRIENLPFDGLIPALQTNKIDLILSSMTATPERARVVEFSEPYLRTGLCLLVAAKSDIQQIGDADRAGRIVAVKRGTTGNLYAMRSLRQAKALVLDKEGAAVLEIVQGKADAFIYDQMSVFSHWQRNRETTRAILTPFQQESWAIAVRKGNAALRDQINAFLCGYREKGGFERLGERWLPEQKAEFARLGIPFMF